MGRLLITEEEKKEILKSYGLLTEETETNNYKSCLYGGWDEVKLNVNGKNIVVSDPSTDEHGNWAVTEDGTNLTDLRFDSNTGTYYNTKNNNSSGKYYCNRYAEIVIDGKPMLLTKNSEKARVPDWKKLVDYHYNQCKETAWHFGPGYAQIYKCGKGAGDKGWVSYESDGTAEYNNEAGDEIYGTWVWDGNKPVVAGDKETTLRKGDADIKFTLMNVNTQKTALNVRDKPSMNGKIVGRLNKGQQVYAAPSGTEGWSVVVYNDDYYYMASRYLQTSV